MDEILSGFDYLTYYFYLLYYKFIGYPIVVRICIAVVTLCVVFYLFLALYLAYGIYRRQREKKLGQRIFDRFYEPLKEVLGDRENHPVGEIAQKVRHDVKKSLKRQEMRFLVQVLIKIKSELGEKVNNYNMQNVQGVFKVGSFFEREIQFGRPRQKIQALLSIQSVNGYVSEAVLVRFLYNRRLELRNAARFAYMWLSQSNPFRFFDEDTTMKLSRWNMAEIHMILIHRQKMGFVVPSFLKWVNSSVEDNVKAFFVSEIKLFDQRDNCPPLLEMINTKTWPLRNEIVRTLGGMDYIEAEPKLVEIYDVQPEYIKQNILTAVAGLQSGRGLGFLHEAFERADDQATKLRALTYIRDYGEQGRELFDQLDAMAEGPAAQLFAHVKHPLTNQA